MQWLKISEGESVNAALDFTSIKSVAKHWTGQRSELCLGEGCPHCLAGSPRRWRYQARLIIDKTPFQWEFGEQAYAELRSVPHDTSWAHVTITRTGTGRDTRYIIADRLKDETPQQPEVGYQQAALAAAEALIRRKYGHIIEE